MSKIQIELCPICEKVLPGKYKGRHGLSVQITYSEGGWGQAKNLLHLGSYYTYEKLSPSIFTEEICTECFDEILPHLNAATKAMKDRRGINRPKEVKL